MNKSVQKTIALMVGVIFVTMLIAGCEEEQNFSNDKKTRLIAAKNIELKEQLTKCQAELEEMEQQFEKTKKERQGQISNILNVLMGENKKLIDENKTLKAQIKELKKQPGKE